MVLTAEASGIALATICAQRYGVPMVFAKKAKSDNIEGGLYQSDIFSYTYKKKVTLLVSQDWITKDDKVLIIDDFMAKGYAMRGLIDIVNKRRRNAGRHRRGGGEGLSGRRRQPAPGGVSHQVAGHHRQRRERRDPFPGG